MCYKFVRTYHQYTAPLTSLAHVNNELTRSSKMASLQDGCCPAVDSISEKGVAGCSSFDETILKVSSTNVATLEEVSKVNI